MNERGFFSVIGICFLLAAAVCVKSMQETAAVYSYGVANFQTELELQNAADSALIEAAEIVRKNPALVPQAGYAGHSYYQVQIAVSQPKLSERLGKIEVKVFAERANIHSELGKESSAAISKADTGGVIFISVAGAKENSTGKKIYRRSLAFVTNDDNFKICYMNDL